MTRILPRSLAPTPAPTTCFAFQRLGFSVGAPISGRYNADVPLFSAGFPGTPRFPAPWWVWVMAGLIVLFVIARLVVKRR
jgi:hypothetical protein